jgi:hypothetical protein
MIENEETENNLSERRGGLIMVDRECTFKIKPSPLGAHACIYNRLRPFPGGSAVHIKLRKVNWRLHGSRKTHFPPSLRRL